MICGFTGHRPEKLPWGSDETDERCAALKQLLELRIRHHAAGGVNTFLCGMARGCDLYFAEAVLKLKGEGMNLRLEGMLPCDGQADRWPEEDRIRYENLLRQCDGVYLQQQTYSDGCMLRRNRTMVDRCDCLISVWDGSKGGTAATIRYAKARGIPIDSLWL